MYKHPGVRMSDNHCPRGREPIGYKELIKPVVSQLRGLEPGSHCSGHPSGVPKSWRVPGQSKTKELN